MKDKYLTTEPPLDQPEYIDYNSIIMKRDLRQKWDDALWNRSYKESETEYHNRMRELQQTFHLNQQSQDDEQCS